MASINNHTFLLATSTSTNCTIVYNEPTNINNIPATFVTNYVMAATGIVSALTVWFVSPGNYGDIWIPAFFAFFAIGNMIVSITALFIADDDSLSSNIMLVVSHLFITISYSALLFTGIKSMTNNKLMRDLWLASTVAILVMASFRLFVALYIWGAIVAIFVACVSIRKGIEESKFYFLKSFGLIIYLIAGLLQVWLMRVCGEDANENCFEECPLPNPVLFNNDAVYHTLTTIGIIFHAIAETKTSYSSPTTRVTPKDENNDPPSRNNQKRSIPLVIHHQDDFEMQPDEELTQDDFDTFGDNVGNFSNKNQK